jgi:L-lysine exporter family protein LysE/ArgO
VGSAGVEGFLISGGLIIAIGAQNAFVLRQGLLRQHVLAVVLFCALSDATLILLGVAGFGTLVRSSTLLLSLVKWGGAAFLAAYAMMALRRAWQPRGMTAADGPAPSLSAALLQCAAFTWANPHVYLDTVVLLGGISATYSEASRVVFAIGAATASFAWFFALGYGARLLSSVFARPRAWQILDVAIAFVMAAIAFKIATMPL